MLELYRVGRTDEGVNLAAIRALNPPHLLWEGVQYYAEALARCVAQRRKDDEAVREARKRAGMRGGRG